MKFCSNNMQRRLFNVKTSKLLAHSQQFGENENKTVPIMADEAHEVTLSMRVKRFEDPKAAITEFRRDEANGTYSTFKYLTLISFTELDKAVNYKN